MELIEYQLKTAEYNIAQAKKQIDKKMEATPTQQLENYHYELLDINLRIIDLIQHLHTIKEGVI